MVELKKALYVLVDCIDGEGIREFTLKMLSAAPDSFWDGPSSMRHRPLDERRKHGNLRHTIRVVRTVSTLCDVMGSFYPQITKDMMMSAAVIHDLCRYGLKGGAGKSLPNHPKLPRMLAERYGITCIQAVTIFDIAEKHMGKWGESSYTPLIEPWVALHIADAFCARALEGLEL